MNKTVKVYISAHKNTDFAKDDVFVPIQVGAAISKKKIHGFLTDNTGENISEKNPKYCELTAQYWVWKNALKEDYVGFVHYRRYLAFRHDEKQKADIWGNLYDEVFTEESAAKYGLDSEEVKRAISDCDIVLPEQKDIRNMPNMGKNNREQFLGSGYLHAEDLQIMESVIKEKYPDYVPATVEYLNGHLSYLNNMYIMRRDIFEEYCGWLFSILEECDKRIDYTDYSKEAIRTLGHLAERLLNIFVIKLKTDKSIRIREFPTVFFAKTDPAVDIKPAFGSNNVAIALAANDYYSPYLATTIKSIENHASSKNNYDLLVMNQDISNANKVKLEAIVKEKKNISIRFVDISRYGRQISSLFTHGHFSIETWFRLVMPEMLKSYNKILYLDSDLVALKDVAELYSENIEGYLLAATHDADTAGLYNGYDPERKNYIDSVLMIKKPFEYFQAGVILFNLEEFRKQTNLSETLKLAASQQWKLLDQDVLNIIAQDKAKTISMAWNVMVDWAGIRIKDIISRAPKRLADEYDEARKNPFIIHYAGPEKPWKRPEMDMGSYFWDYARESGYYEILISRLCKGDEKKTVGAKEIAKKLLPQGTSRGEFVRKIIARTKK